MRKLLSLAVLGLIVASPVAAMAQTTIGTGVATSDFGPLGKDSNGGAATVMAQTFVAPTNFLQAFSIYLISGAGSLGSQLNLSASIFAFSGDHLTGSALGAPISFLGTSETSGYVHYTFGGAMNPLNLGVTSGNTYAIVLSSLPGYASSPDGALVNVGTTDPTSDDYVNGSLFYSLASDSSELSQSGAFYGLDDQTDAAFDATFTDAETQATPEPASMILVATGLMGIGAMARRRKALSA